MFQPNLFSADVLDHPLPAPARMPSSDIRELRPRRAPQPRRSRVRWDTRSTPKTVDLQSRVVAALARAVGGFTVRELGEELGVSRQHALYHVKKAVASGRISMLLEPCEANGGLQFRVWSQAQLARRFARTLPMAERVDLFLRAHHAA
jgi:hypothetical protein